MTLRPDQIQAGHDIAAAFADGCRAPVLVAPTGWGKTFWAVHYIREQLAAGRVVWFVAHLDSILNSTAKRLREVGQPFGWVWAQKRPDYACPLQLVSVLSALSRLPRLQKPDLIIIDECDLAVAPTYQSLLDALGRPLVLGLTATPVRTDGRGLESGGFDRLITTVDAIDLIPEALSPLRLWSFPPPIEAAGLRRRGGDVDRAQAADIFSRGKLLGDALREWEERCIDPELGIRPTVAFCASVTAAEATAARWRAAGYRAMAVSSDSSRAEREDAENGLRDGLLDLVACADLWLAGLDIPEIGALICLRPTLSVRVWLQMVGRLLRKSRRWTYKILHDHAGNLRTPGIGHPLERRKHLWTLAGDAGVGKMKERIAPVSQCPACYSCWRVGDLCGDCGHDFSIPRLPWSDPTANAGQLVEVLDLDPRAALRQRREQEEQERQERARVRKREEKACWNPDDPSGSLARFVALAKMRQIEAGQEVDPVRALRWAQLQVSFRNGSRYPQRRQPVGRVRRVGA